MDKVQGEIIRASIGKVLCGMEPMFVDGVNLTFMATVPGEPDKCVIVTSEDINILKENIQYLIDSGDELESGEVLKH